MPSWPASLPCMPLSGTLSVKAETNVAEFKPDVGPALRRRRYTAVRSYYRGSMRLSGEQVAQLRSFFEDDCLSGTVSFTMRDWERAFAEGVIVDAEFTFDEPPDIQHRAGNKFIASLALTMHP